MIYKGSCHCGNIAFEAEGEITGAVSCNCSICQRKGMLMWFVPRDKLHVLTPSTNENVYTFHKRKINHHFCPKCGIHTHGESTDLKSGKLMAAVNIRCLENFDIGKIPVQEFDGRSLT